MVTRTTQTTVTFKSAFTIPSIPGRQCAGTYRLMIDDHVTVDTPFVELRRIATRLQIPALSMTPRLGRIFSIDASELSTAVLKDNASVMGQYIPVDEMRL